MSTLTERLRKVAAAPVVGVDGPWNGGLVRADRNRWRKRLDSAGCAYCEVEVTCDGDQVTMEACVCHPFFAYHNVSGTKRANSECYAQLTIHAGTQWPHVYYHRLVMAAMRGFELTTILAGDPVGLAALKAIGWVDHLDNIRLHNRCGNLVIKTPSQNLLNTVISVRNTSGTSGLRFNEERTAWCVFWHYPAYTNIRRKQFTVELHPSAKADAEAFYAEKQKIFGAKPRLSFCTTPAHWSVHWNHPAYVEHRKPFCLKKYGDGAEQAARAFLDGLQAVRPRTVHPRRDDASRKRQRDSDDNEHPPKRGRIEPESSADSNE